MATFPADVKYAKVDAAADGDNVIIAAVTGKSIRVLGYVLTHTASLAATITIQDTAATPVVHAKLRMTAEGGAVAYAGGLDAPAFQTAAGTGVEINNPGTGSDTFGHMVYVEI